MQELQEENAALREQLEHMQQVGGKWQGKRCRHPTQCHPGLILLHLSQTAFSGTAVSLRLGQVVFWAPLLLGKLLFAPLHCFPGH